MQATRGTPLTDPPAQPVPPPESPPAVPTRGGRLGLVLGGASVVLAVDAVTKAVAVAKLEGRDPVHVIDGALELTFTRNPGAAFSIGVGATVIFSLVAAAVAVLLVRTAARLRSLPWAVALSLLLGGALGNLADRLFRSPGPLRGHVVDWIRLPHWPVFNIADAAITVGAVLAVVVSLRGHHLDGTRDRA